MGILLFLCGLAILLIICGLIHWRIKKDDSWSNWAVWIWFGVTVFILLIFICGVILPVERNQVMAQLHQREAYVIELNYLRETDQWDNLQVLNLYRDIVQWNKWLKARQHWQTTFWFGWFTPEVIHEYEIIR